MTKISAIICTHNRAEMLRDCLRAFQRQTLAMTDFEVIVVDNASGDDTASLVQNWCKQHLFGRYVREDRLGLTIARNAGLATARSPIVAYTDDDAIVAEDWLERLVNRFDAISTEFVAVGGELDPVWEAEPPDWLRGNLLHNLSVSLRWSDEPRELTEGEWICEANCAYRTSLLKKYGGFPEKLGRVGDLLLSGENYVNELMRLDSLRFFFDPQIRVQHKVPAGRMTKEWMRRRCFWAGITAALLPNVAAEHGHEEPHWPMVRPPVSPEEWVTMLSDDAAGDFAAACARLTELGYLLGVSKVVTAR